MKNTIFKLSLLALLFSSCDKSRDNAGIGSSSNTWTLSGKTYTAASVNYQTSGTQAVLGATAAGFTATTSNALAFNFWALPVNGQQLPITNTMTPGTMMVTATKMVNSVVTSYSNKATGKTASVNIFNNKMNVRFSDTIWVYNNNGSADSLQLSAATIVQD